MEQQIDGLAEIGSTFLSHTKVNKQQLSSTRSISIPWIVAQKGHPYFFTAEGTPWTPIGQNDAVLWPDLQGLFLRRDVKSVERYLSMLVANGVTCLRLMLEYCQGRHRYLETAAGKFAPNMVRFWDDLFSLCAQFGLRILLTPYDTFWMWRQWKYHPYNKTNGGPCAKRSQWLLCPHMRAAIKNRLLFATQRWGSSGVLFGWDLWNELQPEHAGNNTNAFHDFVSDISTFLRNTEMRLYGKTHLQTVSVFGPVLKSHPEVAATIFRHPALDFASSHFYDRSTIDHPKNTVGAALSTGRMTAAALSEIEDKRPFFDSEHGPIRRYKIRGRNLPEAFDDEYFRNMQWAHVASGGAGGGMRWPYRKPHSLTAGMRQAQKTLTGFVSLVNWSEFNRHNWNKEVQLSTKDLVPFACGNAQQAIVWLLRRNTCNSKGMLDQKAPPLIAKAYLPFFSKGRYGVTAWDTRKGVIISSWVIEHEGDDHLLIHLPPVITDLALHILRH